MGSAVIFAGSAVKTLKNQISLNGGNDIITSTTDPTSSAVSANIGSLLLNSSNGKLYRKNDSGSSTNWTEVGSGTQSGINYITNPNAATNTTGWSTYKETDSVSFQDTGDTVTLNSHGISAGAIVAFTSITSTTGISTNTNYYVVNPTTNTFQVASSIGGSALALTTNGSGTMVRAVPKTGTGGTPNVTWTRSTTTPLRGAADFNYSKGAANYMGEGVATDFTIDLADLAKAITISFDYENLSGTYTTGDLTVYIIADPSGTPVIIQPAGYQVQAATAGTKMRFVGTFQTQATGQSYRMVVHTTTPSTSAYDFAFDNFSVGPNPVALGVAMTDWVSYTPVVTGSTSNPTVTATGNWRRIGDSAEIIMNVSGSANGSGYYTFSLPSGLSMDTNKVTLSTTIVDTSAGTNLFGTLLGNYVGKTSSAGTYLNNAGSVFPSTVATSVILVRGIHNVNTDLDWQRANVEGSADSFFTGGLTYSIKFSVPISGWSSNSVMSSDTATNVVAFSAYDGGTSTVSNSTTSALAFGTIDVDTFGARSGNTYVIPVSGYYRLAAKATVKFSTGNVAYNHILYAYKNGSALGATDYGNADGTNGLGLEFMFLNLFHITRLNAGDVIDFRYSTNYTGTSTVYLKQSSVERLSGPAVVTATDTVALSYRNTAGTSLTSGVTKIPFATSYFDTHAAWDGTTFTAPISGTYSFQIQLYFASASFTGTLKSIVLYVDGAASRYLAMMFVVSAYTNTFAQNGTATIKLNAGQQVYFTANHNEGTAKSLDTTSGTNFLSIVRVGN